MRKHWRKIAVVAAILLIFIIPILLFPSLEECVNAIPSYEAYQHQPESLSYFLFSLLAKVRCSGGFIDENSDAIIAIFTIVLTLSTALLWIDTPFGARC